MRGWEINPKNYWTVQRGERSAKRTFLGEVVPGILSNQWAVCLVSWVYLTCVWILPETNCNWQVVCSPLFFKVTPLRPRFYNSSSSENTKKHSSPTISYPPNHRPLEIRRFRSFFKPLIVLGAKMWPVSFLMPPSNGVGDSRTFVSFKISCTSDHRSNTWRTHPATAGKLLHFRA